MSDEPSFLSFVMPGSGSEDSSSPSESDSLSEAAASGTGLTTAFAEEALVVETFEGISLLAAFFAVAFAAMGLEGTFSSSEEDSSSDDSSLDSSLEPDSGLATAFAGEVLVAADFMGEDAFVVTGLDCVGLVAAVPLVTALGGVFFAGAALATGFDGSSLESSLSESSSLSLSLTGFAEDFGIALVAFGGSLGSLSLESEVDSLSLDSEEELALGGALDYIEA